MEDTEEAPPTETTEMPTDVPTEPTATQAPTRDVKTFWNRLDEVLAQFETEVPMNEKPYRSAVFQPDTVSLTSADALPNLPMAGLSVVGQPLQNHLQAESFSAFKIRFAKALVGVKSIQCLSAIIPTATPNIPQGELVFYYYKLRNLTQSIVGVYNSSTVYKQGDVVGSVAINYVSIIPNNVNYTPASSPFAWYNCTSIMTSPNYYDLNSTRLGACLFVQAYGTELPPESTSAANNNLFNRSFNNYSDFVTGLQAISSSATTNYFGGWLVGNIGGAGNISFNYNATMNRIEMIPNPTDIAAGYYFLPAGAYDPNVVAGQTTLSQSVTGGRANTLNLRAGFTWNGIYPNPAILANPFVSTQLKAALYWYMRPYDSTSGGAAWTQNIITANTYGDLVYSSAIKLYCDVTFGSTQDSTGQGGLLSIVPLSAGNLGVGFYQNNFYRPLTKLPDILPDITISMTTDNGSPYYLPNSADVTIELSIEYK